MREKLASFIEKKRFFLEKDGPMRVAKKEIYRIYQDMSFFTRIYLRIKLKICPLLEVEPHVPRSGNLVDLGCGNGLFAHILKLGAPARKITGIDLDGKKIETARETQEGLACMAFQEADIVQMPYPEAEVYTLIDVLYLIPYENQLTILQRCASGLNTGGTLIIKEMDTKPRWKYLWNLFQETLAVKIIGMTLGERFYFRGNEEYQKVLQELGFTVRMVRLDKGYWYPHILYICKKTPS